MLGGILDFWRRKRRRTARIAGETSISEANGANSSQLDAVGGAGGDSGLLEEEEEEDRQDRRRPPFLRQTAQIPHNWMPWAVLGGILDFWRRKRRRRRRRGGDGDLCDTNGTNHTKWGAVRGAGGDA